MDRLPARGSRSSRRRAASRWLRRARRSRQARPGPNFTEGVLGELLHLRLGDIAGDDQDGVIGRVEAVVELERQLPRQLGDLGPPADHGNAIGMIEIKRRRYQLI